MAERDHVPGEGDPDFDARWSELVSELGDLDAPVEPDDPLPDDDPEPSTPRLTYPVAPWAASGPRDWDGTEQLDGAEQEVDEQEAFVPPDPGPVFGGDPLLTMAWLAAAGVPVGVLLSLMLWPGVPTVLLQAAGVVFVLGVGVLLWRMPHRREPDDQDTGAVV